MIIFNEIQRPGYPARTAYNVMNSDLTIAIAGDFNTAGEVLTKTLCSKIGRPYLPIQLTGGLPVGESADKISKFIHKLSAIRTINIAGNGIYSLPHPQNFYNEWMFQFWASFEWCLAIDKIISGGQTGIDEAGIIGAHRLGYNCEVNAPNGWMFMNKQRETIKDEQLFKQRFY